MIERLIEYWLDSASERSYQPLFVQMLLSEGHQVLHSTRHASIEFGKDVIAISPSGRLEAYQLKGNPGGRLTLRQLREIQPQLLELVSQTISFPGAPSVQHQSYLVTNGEIEEEVQIAVGQLNTTFERQGFGPDAVKLVSRGMLLSRCNAIATNLWPVNIPTFGRIIDFLSMSGEGILPQKKFHEILLEILDIETIKPSGPEINRSITSAALVVSICLSRFSNQKNYFALMTGWILFITYTISYLHKISIEPDRAVKNTLMAAEDVILQNLLLLSQEYVCLEKDGKIFQGDRISDSDFFHARNQLVYGLCSLVFHWPRSALIDDEFVRKLEKAIPKRFGSRCLWGEAGIPALLSHYWFFCSRTRGIESEFLLAQLLAALLNSQISKDAAPLASPYFCIEDVVKSRHAGKIFSDDPMEGEGFARTSFFAEPLFMMLVQANLKQTCKILWSKYTKCLVRRFDPDEIWQFGIIHCDNGKNSDVVIETPRHWDDLVKVCVSGRTPAVPQYLLDRPHLLLFYLFIAPQRANVELILFLARKLSPIWFIRSPKPA